MNLYTAVSSLCSRPPPPYKTIQLTYLSPLGATLINVFSFQKQTTNHIHKLVTPKPPNKSRTTRNRPHTMSSSAVSTSFTVSASMTKRGVYSEGPTILKNHSLERYDQAVTYAREITPPPAAEGCERNVWCNEEWDCDGEAGKITFRNRDFPDGVAYEIPIIPPPRYNVTLRYYNSGLPVSDAPMGAAWLKTVEEAVAFARRKHIVGDRWERVGVEEWDMVAGKGRIDYQHCDEGEEVLWRFSRRKSLKVRWMR